MEELNKWLLDRERENMEELERIQATNSQAAAMVAQYQLSDAPRGRGSRPGRAPNVERHREVRGHFLLKDYFVERPVYDEVGFRRLYRMQKHVFQRIMEDLCNFDSFWGQKADATGKMGLLPEQKMTGALRMLAYGAAADQCDEITRMGASTALECLKKFCRQVEFLYGGWFLRPLNPADLYRLLNRGQRRGFPGMIESIDCMHWEWKNCPTGWAGAFSGRKGRPTIILEAVASYDTRIWHAFFGTPGAQNDLNVLGASNVFERVIGGTAPLVEFEVNNKRYTNGYYLADGIYLRWSTFVKTISNPRTEEEKHFCKKQEAYRKDVERCFGILQSRWAILRHGARLFKLEDLRAIMISCIILHNMIVDDEFVEEEFVESQEADLMNPAMATVYDRPVHPYIGAPIPFEPVGRDGQNLPAFMDREFQVESAYLHKCLQDDLVMHNWNMDGN
ncbi:uncharacterized protein LOC112171740 [Rosa chinensis]|uniref:uncharacterized protein LOC112171740 n=1 Tax=Rosa chinensis TaxID=74649 RepID=UPI000D0913FF|nr:uncharacterized protein LOC112171740 [Rosa chinensis]